ncbi:MAG: hypothetical protein ABIH87_04025 [bacterium]
MRGFTLIELLVVVGISIVLAIVATPIYGGLQVRAQLNETSAQLSQTLRTAQQRSLSGYGNSAHGVKLQSQGYILFQGDSYALRQSAYDRGIDLAESLSLLLSLTGGVDEVVFSLSSGLPSATGTINLIHSVDGNRQISINDLGMVSE